MSRIQEAFAKHTQRVSRSATPRRPVGRVLQPSSDAQGYSGKRIQIDLRMLQRHGLLAPTKHEKRLIDQYRAIKRPLLRNATVGHEPAVQHGNLLMVASAFSGEGKTFTCINLCLSIARERDWNVVLVDGDCVKPDLTSLFGAEHEPGLIDALREPNLDIESLIMPTDIPHLALLPAGGKDEQASELLASSRMARLCAEMSKADRRRMIIFDSAPLLLTNESAILASQVGQVVLVVRANHTSQKAALEARDRLDPTKAICLLLNQSGASESLVSYGEYGSYGAGSDRPPPR
jgi:protein-tyrosine kinase